MKHIKLLIALLACIFSAVAQSQTTREKVEAYRAEVKAYGEAVTLITRQHNYAEGIARISSLIQGADSAATCPPERMAMYYKLRAHAYLKTGKSEESQVDAERAVALLEKAGEAGRKDLSDAWYMLALVRYRQNARTEALHAADHCVEAAEDYYGPRHSVTLDAYSLRANFAAFFQDSPLALSDMRTCFDIIRQNVERNMPYLTATERTAYWAPLQRQTAAMPTFAHGLRDYESSFSDAMYDQQLLSKGLLLTAESALQRAIDADATLKAEYECIASLRKTASDNGMKPEDVEKATLEADRRERDLAARAVEFSRFLDFIKVRVGDVKAKLRPGDVAVEFVDYRTGRDSVMYGALVLLPGKVHVRFIPLVEERDFDEEADDLAARLWNPIFEAAGSEVRNIFFAPTGRLHLLPVESWKLPDGTYLCDRYAMHRLSSTRMLAISPDATQGRDGVAYGGLEYDATIAEMQADMQRYPDVVATRSADDVPGASDRSGLGLSPLPGTLAEAEEFVRLSKAARKMAPKVVLYEGTDGTETSFKALSGQHKRLIHIGTHGFFDAKKKDEMNRCGLYFAGAQNTVRGRAIPLSVDDGVLTAHEAAQLDLTGLDLLVLSACQSGLGDVTPDGVFGLQRGFKKAGAGSLLMSLWKVHDDATELLMSKFYTYLFAGDTKLQALERAKRDVRAVRVYSDPMYWAAFVLLDALD